MDLFLMIDAISLQFSSADKYTFLAVETKFSWNFLEVEISRIDATN